MYKPLTFIVSLVFTLLAYTTFAQDDLQIDEAKASKKDTKTINILSLDGKYQKMHIMPDYVHHVLKISCLKDTITIEDYWGVPAEVHILGKHFVQINYEVRGGTGLGLGNMMLLSVQNNKLCQSLYVLRYVEALLD